MKKALVFYGGWGEHTPKEVGELFTEMLKKENYEVDLHDNQECLDNDLTGYDLIVPMWTMGEITKERATNVVKAVEAGTGIAGCHGGMCDAFRQNVEWQFLTGCQWVAHPGGQIPYRVNLKKGNEFTEGLEDFDIVSEQYYVHYDPAIKIYATTMFTQEDQPYHANGDVEMPVVYTKMWGKGKVFYNSLGHTFEVFDIPQIYEITKRGFVWATR